MHKVPQHNNPLSKNPSDKFIVAPCYYTLATNQTLQGDDTSRNIAKYYHQSQILLNNFYPSERVQNTSWNVDWAGVEQGFGHSHKCHNTDKRVRYNWKPCAERKKLWIAYTAHLLRRSWEVWHFGTVYAKVFVDQNRTKTEDVLKAWSHSQCMVNTGLISM